MRTDFSGMAGHHIGTQSLQTACSHLAEVAMQNADVEEWRKVDQLEELDVVAAVESRVDIHGKLDRVRFADVSTQLLHLPAVHPVTLTLAVDWLTELWFYILLDTKQVISEMFPQANLLAWYGKN